MIELGALELYLVAVTAGISFFGMVNVLRPDFSQLINDLVTYGKSLSNQNSKILRWVAVPKRWFSHFYLVATFMSLFWLTIVLAAHMQIIQVDLRLINWLRMCSRNPVEIRPEAALIFCTLICLHSVRRLIETMVVCVYSDSQMNVFHYLVGIIHYIILPVSAVCETSGIASREKFLADFNRISNLQLAGIAAFVWFSYHQHQCALKLAKMRKNHQGNITNYAHGIAYGGLFDYVSCPHFCYEVLLYVSLFLTLNLTGRCFALLVVFVAVNQSIAALITHRWYVERFGEKYPAKRKAIIPYIL
ncbi:hypothetical protein QR680_012074 [Steinernema hermaphroditum]|uniref:Polyprenal reductase n=1 Tax=Steinernema hermaphroditum TaxID=289476 RepID=A0AA39I0T6_9BILA|nr:hypothetical protein QR680_012074 [Steinernema hermaphroditum]